MVYDLPSKETTSLKNLLDDQRIYHLEGCEVRKKYRIEYYVWVNFSDKYAEISFSWTQRKAKE